MLSDFAGADRVVYCLRLYRPAPWDRRAGFFCSAAVPPGSVYRYSVPVLRQTTGSDQGSILGRQRICFAIQTVGVRLLPMAPEGKRSQGTDSSAISIAHGAAELYFLHNTCPGTDCDVGCRAYLPLAVVYEARLPQCMKLFCRSCRWMWRSPPLHSIRPDLQRSPPRPQDMYPFYTDTLLLPPSISEEVHLFLLCASGSFRGLPNRVLLPFSSPLVKFCTEITLEHCR